MAEAAPLLPVSQTTPLLSNPAARAFLSKISEGAKNAMLYKRPWLELVDHKTFSKPESLAEAAARIRKNWSFFRINYMILLCAVMGCSLVSHPVSLLLLMVALGGWLFLYFFRSEPLVLYNRHFTDKEILWTLTFISIAVVFLTDVVSLMISATMVGLAIVCAHGAFRAPQDLFLQEQPGMPGSKSFSSNTAATHFISTSNANEVHERSDGMHMYVFNGNVKFKVGREKVAGQSMVKERPRGVCNGCAVRPSCRVVAEL
ncbi:hypothetical protein KI387_030400, partial [Taxus chinensis]